MPTLTFASFDQNLSYGSKGDSVKELQEFLTDQGVYTGPITGNFFTLSLKAVKAFQVKNNINPVSGFFGPKTRVIANSLLQADLTASDQDQQDQTGTVQPQPVQSIPTIPSTPVTPTSTPIAQNNAPVYSSPMNPTQTPPVIVQTTPTVTGSILYPETLPTTVTPKNNGAWDEKVTFQFVSNNGSNLNEMKFLATSGTVQNIQINGISTGPTQSDSGDVFYLTGLNQRISPGVGGSTIDVYIIYAPVASQTVSTTVLTSFRTNNAGTESTSTAIPTVTLETN